MFKKKNELPPWPKPPTDDQMLEDINCARSDDPVFIEFGVQRKTVSEKSKVETNYDLVKDYLKVTKRLEENMKNLLQVNETLQTSNTELQKMADDIKQQAVNALK